ncbi:response regulator [Streptomyces polyrhachis]|uniref:Response regulator n=1 Tax=Streptomyces polyrhachis TaxID=1282885 RepID=A0ABW2GD97_9ACTN
MTAGELPGVLPPLPPPAPLRVVVADDNPVVRAGLTSLFAGRTDICVVAEAADGREAVQVVQAHRPDVVLLDVRMPGVDGLSALPHLTPLAPVLMLTYSSEDAIVREALRRGASGYLVHGEFTVEQLVGALAAVRAGQAQFSPTAATALLAHLRGAPAAPLPPGFPDQHPPAPDPPARHPAGSPVRPSHVQPDMADSASVAGGGGAGGASGAARQSQADRYGLSQREVEILELIASGMANAQIAATCFISEKTVKNHINRIFAKLQSSSRSEAVARWLGITDGRGRGSRW